jgi:preprotein translocase subunit SecA
MGKIYQFLGLKVGLIQNLMEPEDKKIAYQADVVYGTNNEFGFDYLRDNMVIDANDMAQRGHHYAIVDEVDSILVDEARTPLIISGPSTQWREIYQNTNKVALALKGIVIAKEDKDKAEHYEEKYDYIANEKEHTATETLKGQEKIARILGISIEKLFGGEHFDVSDDGEEVSLAEEAMLNRYRNAVKQSIYAHSLYKKDRDYVVKDGEVLIVDEFTGRLMVGRRYSQGLHEAIEAKEKVKIQQENQTLATITLQNYFRMYAKLAGMTGTAATEADEFKHIYKLDTIIVPSNKPMIRKDFSDAIYKTEEIKFNSVIEDIVSRNKKGQPVLVGTISIEKSEVLSNKLKRRGVPHEVLNAKYHEKEAQIISQAGQKGAVTISTNMAGRGTDIVLGEGVVEVGGLHVMGTERHESRRIDNQLRGRSGRQGDPGSSQFYLSLEDDLMRLFGSDRIGSVMERLGLPDNQPIEHPLISRSIETAQRQIESQNFEMRKHVLEYDDVMNKQREVIYGERRQILEKSDLHEKALEMLEEVLRKQVEIFTDKNVYAEEWDMDGLFVSLNQVFPLPFGKEKFNFENLTQDDLFETLLETFMDIYETKEKDLGEDLIRELERMAMLKAIDDSWQDHLYEMDYLREGIGLRAIGQRDPLIEYKNEAFGMFQEMIEKIKEDFIKYIFHVQMVEETEMQARPVAMSSAKDDSVAREPIKSNKIGRNDPCPCGSGKKYKKCCGK